MWKLSTCDYDAIVDGEIAIPSKEDNWRHTWLK